MPSNIIIKPDSRGGQRGGLAGNIGESSIENHKEAASAPSASAILKSRHSLSQNPLNDPKLNQKILEAIKTKFFDRDSDDWPQLYKYKLLFCYRAANFQADSKKEPKEVEFKEKKREVLIELIDILDESPADELLHTEEILAASIEMIERNIFRTFANKNNKKHQQVDPDEDEPHLEEAWPHMQLVYELFLKFMMSPHMKNSVVAEHISQNFIVQFLELFDSEDPRERDYLKTILHRIYGKYMIQRPYIRTQVMNLILLITYEKEEHNGLTELLEILTAIITGYATPLKPEHKNFAIKVLIPLHKVRGLQNFNTQLLQCMKNFLEKDKLLGIELVMGLLKYWPITCPAKEVVYINEVEEILELVGQEAEKKFALYGPKLLSRLVATAQNMHYQAAERALLLLNSEVI